ncbi:hypothetical protein ACIBEJ_37390 [Nonomuraea sp. NPDC050790]|uniref:hypothetical protein n=1 Tax=Nonomuraea sp. NPDC050790 TaxID=3364371 RepID=UPI0037AEE933
MSLSLAFVLAAPPAQAAGPVCVPEAPVCAGLDGARFVFTIKPPPSGLSVRATVNGVSRGGPISMMTTPAYLQGSYHPVPALVPGDVVCMWFHAPGVPPGPYCDTY